MVASRRISAHVTTVFEVDMSRIVQLKNQHSQDFLNKEGIKLSYMPFFIRIISEGLKEFPMLNASVCGHEHRLQEGHQYWCCRRPGLGAHRARDQNADEKSFLGLARAAVELAERRARKAGTWRCPRRDLHRHESGSLRQPPGHTDHQSAQVAILCIGAITKRPVVIHDAIAIRSMAYLTLTFVTD